jgi:hypothetical protein
MVKNIKNLVLFKLGWIGCATFAANGYPGLAILTVAAVAALHLATLPVKRKEALVLLAAALFGMSWESALVGLGIVSYPGYDGSAVLAPLWIVAMWVLFATTINHGLAWIKRNWVIASTAGLIGGPLAFFGGAGLGAVAFSDTLLAMGVIGIGWAILLPLLALTADTIIDSAWLEPSDVMTGSRNVDPAGPAARMADVVLPPNATSTVRLAMD